MGKPPSSSGLQGILGLLSDSIAAHALKSKTGSDREVVELRNRLTRIAVLEFLALYHEMLVPGKVVSREKIRPMIEKRLAEIILSEQEEITRFSKPKALTAAHQLVKDVIFALEAAGVPFV